MLKKIRLTNFKSFVDEEVELAPLTLLVGANASGKSNFLDALRVLKGLTLDLTLQEVLDGEEKSNWPGIRGEAQEAAREGVSVFSIESTWLTSNSETPLEQTEITHQINFRTTPSVVCESEWIQRQRVPPWLPSTGEQRSILSFHGLLRLLSDAQIAHKQENQGFLQQMATAAKNMIFAADAIRFLEIRPSAMREYGRRSAPLGHEGKNFSGVLADLSEDPTTKHSFITWLREVCAPEIDDLDFIEVKELDDVMAVFVEKGGARISARSISDGTLRFLGTLLALRTAGPGDVLLIEEIEEGLHPTRIQFLLELLESAVRQQGIQVIATTHSPVVLQWLTPERLREALVFGRVPDREGTLVRRLGELPYFEEVIQREGIEELFTTGWLEMAL
jgi:predicted ATPase